MFLFLSGEHHICIFFLILKKEVEEGKKERERKLVEPKKQI